MFNIIKVDYTLVFLSICVFIWFLLSKDGENVFLKLVLRKFYIFMDSIIFMVLSKDSKGLGPKKNPDPDLIKDKPNMKVKTIIFIRHGESDWNNVFNKGINLSLFYRLATAMIQEFRIISSLDSIFLDSPLNHEGIEQALELRRYLESNIGDSNEGGETESSKLLLSVLSGHSNNKSSVIVSSCLRRAIATTTLGLWHRIQKTNEKIYILSSLQEISRNIDTYALSPANTVPDLPFSRITPYCDNEKFQVDKVYDNSNNFGNKTYSFAGILRLKAFNEWAFTRSEDVIIVGGHSLWFKYFFQTFLPFKVEHDAKKKKIVNSGVVSFNIYSHEEEGTVLYRIDPNSIQNIYGGFTSK